MVLVEEVATRYRSYHVSTFMKTVQIAIQECPIAVSENGLLNLYWYQIGLIPIYMIYSRSTKHTI
jgi:hypothetical protein